MQTVSGAFSRAASEPECAAFTLGVPGQNLPDGYAGQGACNDSQEVEKIDAREKLIQLVGNYQNLVFSICLRLTGDYFTAEDLTQETFLAAYAHLSDFDGQSEKAWLCRIAGNKCIDWKRAAERRSIPTEESEFPEACSECDDTYRQATGREVLEALQAQLRALPAPYRETGTAYFLENRTAREISEQTGTPVKTVQTRIYRARELLKKSMRKEDLLE